MARAARSGGLACALSFSCRHTLSCIQRIRHTAPHHARSTTLKRSRGPSHDGRRRERTQNACKYTAGAARRSTELRTRARYSVSTSPGRRACYTLTLPGPSLPEAWGEADSLSLSLCCDGRVCSYGDIRITHAHAHTRRSHPDLRLCRRSLLAVAGAAEGRRLRRGHAAGSSARQRPRLLRP